MSVSNRAFWTIRNKDICVLRNVSPPTARKEMRQIVEELELRRPIFLRDLVLYYEIDEAAIEKAIFG